MLICGIKASHDGAVALIDGNRLIWSVELEKIANHKRHAAISDLEIVSRLLRSEGVSLRDVTSFVVDGWYPAADDDAHSSIPTTHMRKPVSLPVAPYLDRGAASDCLELSSHAVDGVLERRFEYKSCYHVTSHILAAYCTSPFAFECEPTLVVVWDGGMAPRAYRVEASHGIQSLGPILPLVGNLFAGFAGCFTPFYRDTTGWDRDAALDHHLSIAGKAMAYAALGTSEEQAFGVFDRMLAEFKTVSWTTASLLGERVQRYRDTLLPGLSDADIIATFQDYLGARLARAIARLQQRQNCRYLSLTGGCALNIKWNAALRNCGLFQEVWVPPFPNDAGSAIGAACSAFVNDGGLQAMSWDVYSGPELGRSTDVRWAQQPCDAARLAAVMHETGEPVVVLHGRAELGPRALGHRSVFAPPGQADMKSRLNMMKGREEYRPVAPICLEDRAPVIFDPGTPDPYMLFEHHVRSEWRSRIPAVLHLDGTARLQTVNKHQEPFVAELLAAYESLSGLPLLCNTSANLAGSGFFPDVASAATWGQTKFIWSEGMLFTRPA